MTVHNSFSTPNNKANNPVQFDKLEVLPHLISVLESKNLMKSLGAKPRQQDILVWVVDTVLAAAKAYDLGLKTLNEFIYAYTGKYWQPVDKEEMKKFLSNAAIAMGIPVTKAIYFEFADKLLKQFQFRISQAYLNSNSNKVMISLQNGTYEVTPDGHRLREHSPEDFMTYMLPFSYDPDAVAPKFVAFLDRCIPDNSCQDILAEYLGYVFTRHLKMEKCLLLYGDGANGKSVFFEIVRALLGKESFSSYSLGSLNEEYNRAMISNALLNYGSEIKNGIDSDIFKTLVSGEPIQARLKYGNPFTMENYAKLAFNANELPNNGEHSEAYYRRFIIVPFMETIPEKERVPELAQQIIAEELPGIFNWVLKGLDRLLVNKRFSHSDSVQEIVAQFRRENDPVSMFLDETGYRSGTETFPLQKLYNDYRTFSINNGLRPMSCVQFSRGLKTKGFELAKRNFGKVVFCTTDNPMYKNDVLRQVRAIGKAT